MTEAEKLFEEWYDNRKAPMPPGAFESWLAGYMAAKESK